MSDLEPRLVEWLHGRTRAVLATTRADGTPQTSNVMFGWDGVAAQVSVTAPRAKTVNMRRSPRVVLHVLGDTFWQYAALTCVATLSEVSAEPGDATGQALLVLYERAADKPHPEPDEFFAAMVAEQRLLATLTPVSAVPVGIDA
jgi:PPOX class probable F420-dependent enzyme